MRKASRFVLVAIFAVTWAFTAFAQNPTGVISGKVIDPNGAVVTGAAVKITEKATNRELTTQTNDEGYYEARNLPPGSYSVRVEQAGFSASVADNVIVQTGQVAAVDVQLKLGDISNVVNVQGTEAQLTVDTTRQTVDGVVTAEKITQLALNGRNFLDLAALQPSVRVQDGGNIDPTKVNAYRAVSVNGSSGTGTRVQIDGIDVTDETVGTTTANISTDAVQEFQLSRSSFDLSTSLTTTGAVNISTRSGSNEWHGSGFYFWRNEKISARRFDQEEKPPSSRTQQGFRLGGPILKNKVFFFFNGEHSSELGQNVVQINPPFQTFSAADSLPIRARYVTAKVDWTVTDSTKIFYSHRYNDDNSTGGTVISPFQNNDWTNVHVIGADITGERLTHSLRFGFVNFNNRIESRELGVPFLTTPQGTPYQLNINDLSIGPNSLAPQQTYQDNKQFKYDGSWSKGHHTFRFGGEINRIVLGGFANFAGPLTVNGDFTAAPLGSASDPLNYPLLSFSTGPNSGFFTAQPAHGLPFGGHFNTRTGWYVGDSWRLRPNLTLNLGLRHNRESNMFAKGAPVLPELERYGVGRGKVAEFPWHAFSPQVGFAWDPTGNGRTSIRGGFYLAYEMNIFNNSLFDEFARIATGIGPTAFDQTHIVDPLGNPIVVPITSIACPDAVDGNYECLLNAGLSTRATLADLGRIHNAVQVAFANFFPNYDPNTGISEFANTGGITFGGQFPGDYRIPYSMQFNVGIQRELAKNHVLSVDYVRIRGVGLPFMLVDEEFRRDARFFSEPAARSSLGTRLGVAPAAVNPTTIQAFIDARTAGGLTTNIGTFALASDGIWPGLSPDLIRARLLNGGFTLYQGLQAQINGRFGTEDMSFLSFGEHRLLRGLDYTISYALSRAEATSGAGRQEFITNTTRNNANFNEDFGPTLNDRTHLFGAGLLINTIGGFNINPTFRFGSAPPVSLFVPFTDTFAGSNFLFTTDLNGDGGSTATRGDLLPGTNSGWLGSRIGSWSELNKIISDFNSTFAGKLTPHGQRLVQAGLFSEAQLVALGATVKPITAVPENNPWPFEGRFSTDVRVTRPIKILERVSIEPYLEVFNLFNNTPKGTYAGLNHRIFGNLNFPYAAADIGDLNGQVRGLIQNPRQFQFGFRVSF